MGVLSGELAAGKCSGERGGDPSCSWTRGALILTLAAAVSRNSFWDGLVFGEANGEHAAGAFVDGGPNDGESEEGAPASCGCACGGGGDVVPDGATGTAVVEQPSSSAAAGSSATTGADDVGGCWVDFSNRGDVGATRRGSAGTVATFVFKDLNGDTLPSLSIGSSQVDGMCTSASAVGSCVVITLSLSRG